MSQTTETVRNQGFMPLASDVPDGMTLTQYRGRRQRQAAGRGRRLGRRGAATGRR